MENLFIFLQEQWLLATAFAVFAALLLRHESAKGGEKLSCTQAIQASNGETAILLDVRERSDFESGHIAGAIHIAYSAISDSLQQLEKHRQKQIIVIDKQGQHASQTVKTLAEKGFSAARLNGGMMEWQQNNLPLVKK